MEEVEAELEEGHIAEAIGLALEHLDLIVRPFQGAGRDPVFEIRHEAGTMFVQGVGERGEVGVVDSPGRCGPIVQEGLGRLLVGEIPELAEILLEDVGLEKGFIDGQEVRQPGFTLRFQVLLASQEQEPASFDHFAVFPFQGVDQIPSRFIDGLTGEGNNVEAIVNDVDFLTEDLFDGLGKSVAHVHGHGFGTNLGALEFFEKGDEGFGLLPLFSMEDHPSFEVHRDGHVLVPLLDGELVYGQVLHLLDAAALVAPFQVSLEQILHQVPAEAEELGHVLDGRDAAKTDDETTKRPKAAPLAVGEGDGLPGPGLAMATDLRMTMKDNLLRLDANGQAQEGPLEFAIERQVPLVGAADSAGTLPRGAFDVMDHLAAPVLRLQVAVAFESQGSCVKNFL